MLNYVNTKDKINLYNASKLINDKNIKTDIAIPYDKAINNNYILGLIEAEGHFGLNIRKQTGRNDTISCAFNISQKDISIGVLQNIANYININ
ncbi:hypothetical protein HGI15_22140 [Modestobacter lapidis]|nr:hypothetical protein [Modestobacter lapidis]